MKTIYPSAKESLLNLGSSMSVEYTVTVPEGTNLQLSGVNGTITIAVPASEVSCETTNGSIRVEGARLLSATTVNGRIRFDVENVHEVSSTNGSVEGTLRSLKPSGGKVETVNGSVTLSLPEGRRRPNRGGERERLCPQRTGGPQRGEAQPVRGTERGREHAFHRDGQRRHRD